MPRSKRNLRVFAISGTVLSAALLVCAVQWPWGGGANLPDRQTGVLGGSKTVAGPSKTWQPPVSAMLASMMKGEDYPQLTRKQLETFIDQEGRSAESLLTGYLLSREDTPWLKEAADQYPDNPRVSAIMLSQSSDWSKLSGEWIQRMQQNDPKNSLGWCYAAMAAIKSENKDDALEALGVAAARGRPHAYAEEAVRGVTKAYLSAGYPTLQAEMLGMANATVSHLPLLMELSKEVRARPEIAQGTAGEDLLALSDSLKTTAARGTALDTLVSSAIDKNILGTMEWYAQTPGSDLVVAERMAKAETDKAALVALTKKHAQLLPSLSDTEMKQYLRRIAVEGEVKAMQWVVQIKNPGS